MSKMSENATGMTARHMDEEMTEILSKDIIYPTFYHDYGEFRGIQLTMGQFFSDNAHYDRYDQFVCALDGTLELLLVPHVYRQEMMPSRETQYHHEGKGLDMIVDLEVHESPINLFNIDEEAFPTAKHIDKKYEQTLNRGDCLYIPSFYFYQVHGKAQIQQQRGERKPAAMMLSI